MGTARGRRGASEYRRKRAFSCSRSVVVLLSLLGLTVAPNVLPMLLVVGAEGLLPVVTFVEAYPERFLAFYRPKVAAFATLMQSAAEELDVSEQVSEAWDFTVAFITVACVYHVIETIRAAAVGLLSPSADASPSRPAVDK